MNEEEIQEIIKFIENKGFKDVAIDWSTIQNDTVKNLTIAITGCKLIKA